METMIVKVGNQRDARKLRRFSSDNGWETQSMNQVLKYLVKTAPVDVPLSDEDIMNEIRDIRKSYNYAN